MKPFRCLLGVHDEIEDQRTVHGVKPGDIVSIPDHRTWVERGADEGTYHVFLWRCLRCGRKRGRGRGPAEAGGSEHSGNGSPHRGDPGAQQRWRVEAGYETSCCPRCGQDG